MFTKTMSGVLKTIRTALPSFDSHESQRKSSTDEPRPLSVSYKYNVHVMCGTDEQVMRATTPGGIWAVQPGCGGLEKVANC